MPNDTMPNDTKATQAIRRNICNAMCEHHYDHGSSCADDCLINRLLRKYIERYAPKFSETLASAKDDRAAYLLLLLKLYELAPTAANKEKLENFKRFCLCSPEGNG